MGTLWYKSRSVEWDMGMPAAGAKAFFFLGGVQGTPVTVYVDAAEASPHPNPVVADGNGRWPSVFIPFMTSYGVRVTNEFNVQLWMDDLIPNPNPVDVNVTVPIEERVQTGMVHWEPTNIARTAYVRANGRTIGNASSGASERAHADTSNLFVYLWNSMPNSTAAVLPGGRGGSAAADFGANKTIALPDMRGAIQVGLDDMGAAAGGFFTPGIIFVTGGATTPGSTVGVNSFVMPISMMPAHTHTGATDPGGAHNHGGASGNDSPAHVHAVNLATTAVGGHTHGSPITSSTESALHTHDLSSGTTNITGSHIHTFNGVVVSSNAPAGGGNFLWAAGTTTTNPAGDHSHTLAGSTGSESQAHSHTVSLPSDGSHSHNVDGFSAGPAGAHTHPISSEPAHTHTFTLNATGASDPINKLPRSILGTWFIKL